MPFGALAARLLLLLALACGSVLSAARLRPADDRLSLLRLTDCALPCWIGIVPGRTTIAEARERVLSAYSSPRYGVQTFEPTPGFSLTYRFRVSLKSEARHLLIILNGDTSEPQRDTSVIHEVMLHPQSGKRADHPAVIDMILFLGRPGCLRLQYGQYQAWPTMIFPAQHASVSLSTVNFEISPELTTSVEFADRDVACRENDVSWTGISSDYQAKLLESLLP